MKLFHFLPERWALEAIKKQRIKVSKYSDFNDPFELNAMSLGNESDRSVIVEANQNINTVFRILCCSANWQSPLLWAHYGDKHKGVALEFEVPNSIAEAISYRKSRELIDLDELFNRPNQKEAKRRLFKLYNTKYIEWGYEDEYRIQFSEGYFEDNGNYFYKLDLEIKLTGIILGALNELESADIQKIIPAGQSLSITKTIIADNSFNIDHDKKVPIYTIKGST